MATITLHRYYNNLAIQLDGSDIENLERFSAKDDATWHPESPTPFTKVTLKDGTRTSEGVGNAYVKETPAEIRKLCAV